MSVKGRIRMMSKGLVGLLTATALAFFVGCGESGGECPPKGGLPDGGTLEEPLGDVMLWKVFLLPDGATDRDDGDVMHFSFVENGEAYEARLCASSLDATGGIVVYVVDCDLPDPLMGTATLDGRELSIELDDEGGTIFLNVTVSEHGLSFEGRAEYGEMGWDVQGRRVD